MVAAFLESLSNGGNGSSSSDDGDVCENGLRSTVVSIVSVCAGSALLVSEVLSESTSIAVVIVGYALIAGTPALSLADLVGIGKGKGGG